jgi:hypothetical protein
VKAFTLQVASNESEQVVNRTSGHIGIGLAGGLHEVAIAGATGPEDGVADLLHAIKASQHLQLLDIRGIAVTDEVGPTVTKLVL